MKRSVVGYRSDADEMAIAAKIRNPIEEQTHLVYAS